MDVEALKEQLNADDPAARQQFWTALVAHQPEAWKLFYAHFRLPVFRIAYRILQNKEDAEDACQDTFHRLSRAKYDPTRPFYPLIHCIATRAAIAVLRRRQGQGEPVSLSDAPEGEWLLTVMSRHNEAPHNPEEDTMLKELCERVKPCLAGLCPRQKNVVLLVFYKQLPYREVGSVLNIALGAVYNTLQRALKRLKDCVERGG